MFPGETHSRAIDPTAVQPSAILPRRVREAVASAIPALAPRPSTIAPVPYGDCRQPDDFLLYGPPQRWISNPLRLLALLETDRLRIASGHPTRHAAEIAHLERGDLSLNVGRYYSIHADLDEATDRHFQAVGRRLVNDWLSSRRKRNQNNPVEGSATPADTPLNQSSACHPRCQCSEDQRAGVRDENNLGESIGSGSESESLRPGATAGESPNPLADSLAAAVQSITVATAAMCDAVEVIGVATRSHRVATRTLARATKSLRAAKKLRRNTQRIASERPQGRANRQPSACQKRPRTKSVSPIPPPRPAPPPPAPAAAGSIPYRPIAATRFAAPKAILVLAILLLAACAGWMLWSHPNKAPDDATKTPRFQPAAKSLQQLSESLRTRPPPAPACTGRSSR
jgi:hypothetical protein